MSRMRIEEIEIRDADIFEILLDSFPDMIHSVDDKGNIVYTNKTAEKLLGYSTEELLSMNIRQIYADKVLEALEQGFSDLKQKGDKSVESILKAKDETEIPVEIRSFSIYNDNGRFIRTFSILRDLREIKELQNNLIHAGRLAAIGELASGVAHDINNPLTVILLSNEMALRELNAMDSSSSSHIDHVKTYTHDVHKASKSIQKLADHLRNFSRGMVEKYEILDLYECISDALFITSNKIQTANVNLINKVRQNTHFIDGSPNQIEQVFVNIIGNACDAMAKHTNRNLTISVTSYNHEDKDLWKCDISDTGVGVPQDLIEEIFNSFFTTKEKGKGTGLGLSISRGIIQEHKGEIKIASEEGKGSTFSIFLPQAVPLE